jgi:hypothetical protein
MTADGTLTDIRVGLGPARACALERPSLRTVLRRVALNLLIACVVPATLFYLIVVFANVWAAIVVALAWCYGVIAWRVVTRRRASGLLILTAIIMTGRTAIALTAHSTFLYFLQPVLSEGVVATAFLLSLATARPVVARLAGDFYPMDHELSVRPRIKRLFWHLTLMWALLCLGKGLLTLWLLHSQSLETFVLVKNISILSINVSAIATTIAVSAAVARKEGLMGRVQAEIAVPVPA